MAISTVGVVGAGQMGLGIAQVAATSGIDVILQDISAEGLKKAQVAIEGSLAKLTQKGKLTEAVAEAAWKRIRFTQTIEDMGGADLAIEAATENTPVKYEIFRRLDGICREGTILATNTSSISITSIAAQTGRPDRVIGMHFMNPVPLMKLVELIRGLRTSDETYRAVRALGEKMGKDCIESKDYPGFVVNRVLMPMINEACFAVFEGLASIADVDNAMKLGTNQPMGPLALADFIGLDTCLAILNVLHDGLGDPKYRPCPLLKQYVAAGLMGRKTKQGFYKYES
jgi:3-hydroxybutyryl-CoA dehydrogenase